MRSNFRVLILRPAQPLFFGNAEPIFAAINRGILASPIGSTVVASLEETFELDTTAVDALLEFDANMKKQGVAVDYALMHDAVKDMLALGGGGDLLQRSSYSVDDAAAAAREN